MESEKLKEFIQVCLERDPLKRPTAQRLLRHPFLAEVNPDQHRQSMDNSRSSSSEDLFGEKSGGKLTSSSSMRRTRDLDHMASLGEDDEMFQPQSLELFDAADESEGPEESSVRRMALTDHGHKVLPSSLLHTALAASPPLDPLEDQVALLASPVSNGLLSNSSLDSSLRRSASASITAIDSEPVIPDGVKGKGRQWVVEVVHDNGLQGDERFFQLRFSGAPSSCCCCCCPPPPPPPLSSSSSSCCCCYSILPLVLLLLFTPPHLLLLLLLLLVLLYPPPHPPPTSAAIPPPPHLILCCFCSSPSSRFTDPQTGFGSSPSFYVLPLLACLLLQPPPPPPFSSLCYGSFSL